jgi:hypothetical protein
MPSPFLSGLSTDPNAQAMQPYYGMTPNPNQGWASAFEKFAGQMAPQFNVAGTATNTTFRPHQQYGYGGGIKTQFGSIQDMIDAGKTWQQIYSLASQGGYGVNANDYYRARTAGSGVTNLNGPQGSYQRPLPTYGEGQVAGWGQQGNALATPRYGYQPQPTSYPPPAPVAGAPAAEPAARRGMGMY